MKKTSFSPTHVVLVLGDLLILGIVTLTGFATHQALDTAGAHILTTFLPLTAAWFLIAPHLKSYDLEAVKNPRELWRPFWTLWLAAPLMGLLRALWLNTLVIPVFVLVIGGVSSIAMLVWRSLFILIFSKRGRKNG
jgi:hypothetical protein